MGGERGEVGQTFVLAKQPIQVPRGLEVTALVVHRACEREFGYHVFCIMPFSLSTTEAKTESITC